MKAHAAVLFLADQTWRVGVIHGQQVKLLDLPADSGKSPAEQVHAFQQRLAAEGFAPGEVVLAVPSAWCLSATLTLDDVVGRDARTLLFTLEEQLPIAAEEVAAGFVTDNRHALGVCVSRERLTPWVEALESRGWSVVAICPTPLLALAQWLAGPSDADSPDAVLAQEGEQWVLLPVEAGVPRSWHLLSADPEDLHLRLRMLALQMSKVPLRLLLCGLPAAVADSLTGIGEVSSPSSDDRVMEVAATQTASAILAGRRRPPADLTWPGRSRDWTFRLHRPLTAVGLSFLVLLLALALALLLASWRMDRQVVGLQAEQARLFHVAVPRSHRPVPRQVSRYLASELERLQRGAERPAEAPSTASALQMLSDLVQRCPEQVSLQLSRLRLDATSAELAGQVSALEDVGRLAACLSADGTLRVQPAQTAAAQNKGVSFTLQVQRASTPSVPRSDAP